MEIPQALKPSDLILLVTHLFSKSSCHFGSLGSLPSTQQQCTIPGQLTLSGFCHLGKRIAWIKVKVKSPLLERGV